MLAFRHRQRRAPMVALVLLTTPLALTMGAQLPRVTTDSVALLPALRLAAASSGASVAVIDSAAIASSAARTLSELLLARVPGLSVRHRGGTELDGLEISSRGMGPAGGMAPLLVIDGVMADAHQGLPVPGTTVTISRLDDLTPAEVQRVEVLRGPTASALYGPGASAGVIVVTTRRGSAGPLRLRVNAGAGLTEMAAQFPANYQLTNGTPQQYCNPRAFGTKTIAECAPMTLYSWNPLEQASPFETGRALSGGVALSGATRGFRLFGGVSGEKVNGVTSDDWQSRIGVHGSVERSLPGNVTVSAQGSYLQRDASAPTRGYVRVSDNVIMRGLLGRAYDDSIGGFLASDPTVQVEEAAPSLARVASALRIGWQPLAWLSLDALAGQDRSRESALHLASYELPTFSSEEWAYNRDRWTSGTMHAGVMARYGGPAAATLATYIAYDDVRTRDQAIDSLGNSFGDYDITWTSRASRDQAATVQQHVTWNRLDVNAGTRFSVGRGISAPFGVQGSRNVDASYHLPSIHPGVDLRLRGAAGIAPLVPAGRMYLAPAPSSTTSGGVGYGYTFGSYAVRELQSRAGEREGGVDADFGTRARLGVTVFRSQARDAVVGTELLTFSGFPVVGPLLADVTNSGIEAVLSAQLLHSARIDWRSTMTAATLRSHVDRFRGRYQMSSNGSLTAGYPLQGYWQRDVQWSDANGDGLIATGEVLPSQDARYVGPSRPTLEIGLQNALAFPRGITLSALLDYRAGQYGDNRSESMRCLVGSRGCQGMQDVTMSLEDQARWAAISVGYVNDITPASYLRLRELVLEWMPAGDQLRSRGFAVRVVGQNLLTWTQYDGIDPEVGESSFEASAAPSELFQSPLPRRVRVEARAGVM